MSHLQRREFLAATGLAAALMVPKSAEAGDPSFMNNAPDPLLADDELPTFKFALEQSEGKVIGKSYGKEATVRQLPISKGIAGVSMKLEPGAMRELHWHATAAEWAFVIEGRVRTTVIDPEGGAETNDFGPGDVWYFPRGHGHMLQCLGHEPCHFILIFDNGHFSEFGTFSITDWIGHTPRALLAKNFGLPESAFDGFPKEEVYFARGPVPPETMATPLQGWKAPALTHKYELLKRPPHRSFRGGREWRVDSSAFPISKTVTGVILDLEPGGLRELHWHPTTDEWQYVIDGDISVTLFGSHGRFRIETLAKGDVGYIPQGYGHSIENVGQRPCRVLIGFNTGVYQTIDLSEWIAGNPLDVLATNFGKPASLFEKFPHRDVFIAPKEGANPNERNSSGKTRRGGKGHWLRSAGGGCLSSFPTPLRRKTGTGTSQTRSQSPFFGSATTTLLPTRLGAAAMDEVRRIIREEEPPRPSTRLSSSDAAITALSARRGSDPRRLSQLIRRELDWIVMKCLEKDRNRRYETADGLARDLGRYMNDERVHACPPSLGYRLRVFARRHRASLGTAALLPAIALAGCGMTIWQAFRAAAARDAAVRLQLDLSRERQKAAEERANAIAHDLETLNRANSLIESARSHVDFGEWAKAEAALNEALALRPDHSSVWLTRGHVYGRLGLWDLADADLRQAWRLQKEPGAVNGLYLHALLRLYARDEPGYRALCEQMTRKFDARSDSRPWE